MELLWRRFNRANKTRKWINPGFMAGPYLPIYGFGLCTLYLLASMEQMVLKSIPREICMLETLAMVKFGRSVWMKKAIAEHYGGKLDPAVFGEYAGIAQQYMFFYQRSGMEKAALDTAAVLV